MVEFIRQEGAKRAIVIIAHNLKIARMLEGNTALIVGGWTRKNLFALVGKIIQVPAAG